MIKAYLAGISSLYEGEDIEEITIIVNQKELSKFEKAVIKDVSVNHIELSKWNEVLHT